LKLDPATAEVTWWYAEISDPYGISDDSDGCIGRVMFARAPDSELWISQYELPEATNDALAAKMANEPEDELDWLLQETGPANLRHPALRLISP
jgi:hypothetical protein